MLKRLRPLDVDGYYEVPTEQVLSFLFYEAHGDLSRDWICGLTCNPNHKLLFSDVQGHGKKWEDCNGEPSVKQQRTTNHLLHFCDLILKYENYSSKTEPDNSLYSPSGSDRTNDSYSTESNSSFSSDRVTNERHNAAENTNDDDSWDLITCHCMKPFAGRPMIECTECQTWIHMSCAKIRRNNIPEDFVCQQCREARSSTRRSERIRSEDRRIVSP